MTLDEVADRLAIEDLLHRYATGLDARDWRLLRSVFTEDGVADYGDYGGAHEGPDAIVALCRGALQGLDASQHMITNARIEVEGDEARATCYFQAQHVYAGAEGGDTYLVGGTYEDEIVRAPDGWRIRYRRLIPTWSTGNVRVFEAAAARGAAVDGGS